MPRPTPPPSTSSLPGHTGTLVPFSGAPTPIIPSSQFGGYAVIPPTHSLASPHHHHSAANMFAPPILPLSSMSAHAASQPSPFGPSGDSLYPGRLKRIIANFFLRTQTKPDSDTTIVIMTGFGF